MTRDVTTVWIAELSWEWGEVHLVLGAARTLAGAKALCEQQRAAPLTWRARKNGRHEASDCRDLYRVEPHELQP